MNSNKGNAAKIFISTTYMNGGLVTVVHGFIISTSAKVLCGTDIGPLIRAHCRFVVDK